MSANRNQFERYKMIHEMLSKNQMPTMRMIAERYINTIIDWENKEVEDIKRTVYNDIEAMQGAPFFAPIIKPKKQYQYDPDKPAYSLFNVLNTDEASLAHDLKIIFNQFSELPIFKGLEPMMLKVQERFKTEQVLILDFEQNKDYEGLQHIYDLYENIKNKICLKLNYIEFGQTKKEYTISPYLLKEFNNRWHIYGWDHINEDIVNIPLDRIKKIGTSSFKFREQKENELDFLNHLIGFTWTKDFATKQRTSIAEIVFKVENIRANYITSKPLHSSQIKLSKTEEGYEHFSIKVYPNKELIALLLSFGKDLVVISPPEIREEMIENIKSLIAVYEQEIADA